MPLGDGRRQVDAAARERRAHERPERSDGRGPDELRPVTIEPGFVRTATGSALIAWARRA